MKKNNLLLLASVALVASVAWLLTKRITTDTKPLQIGSLLALTGPASEYGQGMKRGLEMAVDETNRSGGVNGKIVALKIEDTNFSAPKAITAFRKLADVDGARHFVGITGSKLAIPIAEAAKEADVIIVDALSSAPALSTIGGTNYFRVMAADTFAASFNAEWAKSEGAKKIAIVYVNDDWGTSYLASAKAAAAQQQLEAPLTIPIIAGSLDFKQEAEKIAVSNVDAIFLLTYAKEGGLLLQQLRTRSFTGNVYGSDNLASADFLVGGETIAEGTRVALPAEPSGESFERFKAAFQLKYGMTADVNAIKSYDAGMVLFEAMRDVGIEPKKIADHLRDSKTVFHGLGGEIRFDSHGDLVSQSYSKLIYRAGKLAPIEK